MLKLIGLLTITTLLGALPIWWVDHTSISFTVPAPIRWVLPTPLKHFESLASQRDHARQALQIAQDGETRCRLAIQTQNTSISAASDRSAKALAKSSADIAATKPQSDRALKASRDLTAHVVVGAGELDRWHDSDQAVVASLKP